MNRFEQKTENIKKPETQENHETSHNVESPEELRQRMISEAEKQTDQFKQECTEDLSRVEVRAENNGLVIDIDDRSELQDLEKEADAANSELVTEIHDGNLDKIKRELNELHVIEKKLELKQLQDVAVIGYDYIKKYAERFGIQVADFSPDVISWMSFGDGAHGLYNYDSNTIKIGTKNISKTFKTILHEQIHYASSLKNSTENSQDFNGKRIMKGGFSSYWKSREQGGKDRDIFRALDEAVTEKIARELFGKCKDELHIDLKDKFPETINSKRDVAIRKKDLDLDELGITALERYNDTKKYMMEEESFENFFAYKKRLIDSNYKNDMANLIDKSYTGSPPDSYSDEIKVLDAILEKLAKKTSFDKNISFEEALSEEWIGLQKAYLDGNTLYLKKIDKNIGAGTLRLFNGLNRTPGDRNEEEENDFENKVKNLIDHIK